MSEDFTLYIIGLIAIIIAVFLIKRFVSCLIRVVISLVLTAVLAYIYFMYLS